MATAYSVGTAKYSGRKTWWVNWEMAQSDMTTTHDDVREATAEEAALMEKAVWKTDTPDDLAKLRELLET